MFQSPHQAEHEAARGLAGLRNYCSSDSYLTGEGRPSHSGPIPLPSRMFLPTDFTNVKSDISDPSIHPTMSQDSIIQPEPIHPLSSETHISLPPVTLPPIKQHSSDKKQSLPPINKVIDSVLVLDSNNTPIYHSTDFFQFANKIAYTIHRHQQKPPVHLINIKHVPVHRLRSRYQRRHHPYPYPSATHRIDKDDRVTLSSQDKLSPNQRTIETDDDEGGQSPSSSFENSSYTHRHDDNGREKPRWTQEMRALLFSGIVAHKGLADMTSFDWTAIGEEVGRSGKACKDQWRRAILPKIQQSFEKGNEGCYDNDS